MRALVTDPHAIDAGVYRRFIQRAQLQGLLADYLVGGEPYLALNAVVLGSADSHLLRRLTAAFASALERAGRAIARDPGALSELGFPWVAAELLAAEPHQCPLVGRFDFVQDGDGHWWLLEFNADTPSGVREAIVADRLVRELLPEARPLARPSGRLGAALAAAFGCALGELPSGAALGLVTDAGELEDLAQMAFTQRLLRERLATRGIDVVLGDIDNLRPTGSRLTLCGHPIAALYRYFPFELMLGTPAFAAIYDAAAAGRLRLLNGLFGLLLQNKGLLAWLWSHGDDPMFTGVERAAIREHLPATWMIDSCPAGVSPSALVAKQVFGREGEEVFFGADLAPAEWELARRRRTYVAQRRVRIAEMPAVIPSAMGFHRGRGCVTVGCYAVMGRWAGYYSRFGAPITTARAKWLATFVQ